MNYKWLALIAGVLVFGGVVWWLGARQAPHFIDYKSATIMIDGKPVTLVNGVSAEAGGMGEVPKSVTQYLGDEAKGDLNGDGIPDVAFLLTQSNGENSTLYYVVAALTDSRLAYALTNAVLLGDRIAPASTEIKSGQIIVDYAMRKAGEDISVAPSVGVSKFFIVKGTTLKEVK